MRKILIGLIVLTVSSFAASMATVSADTYVNGYRRSDGTYVQPHHRSDPDEILTITTVTGAMSIPTPVNADTKDKIL